MVIIMKVNTMDKIENLSCLELAKLRDKIDNTLLMRELEIRSKCHRYETIMEAEETARKIHYRPADG
jgi:hypothetical protein